MNTTHTPCRYEITNREDGISIASPDGIVDQLIASDPEDGLHLDDVVIGAIRQQARDLELLTNMLHNQRIVIDDLEHRRVKVCDENDQLRAELQLCCELKREYQERAAVAAEHAEANARLCASTMVKLATACAKVAALEANCNIQTTACNNKISELAAAVAERDRLISNEAGLLNSLKESHNARFKLEARLAAIDGAPTVAHMRRWEYDGVTPFKERNANGRMAWPAKFKILPVTSSIRSANVKAKGIFADDVELIARPAKDQP